MDKSTRNMLILLAALVVLSPLGLIYAGETFGESTSSAIWNVPLANYGIPGATTPFGVAAGYVLSAMIGVAVCGGAIYVLGKMVAKND